MSGPARSDDGAPRRKFYGRRRGKRLREGQASLIETELSRLTPPGIGFDENPNRTPLDLTSLFPGKDVWLEIGFGGGEHMIAQAAANPGVQIIGADPFINGVAKLLAAIERAGAKNLSVTDADARDVMDVIPDASIERVYLLYPDPWPKARHHKRRFANPDQVTQLSRIMVTGAELRIATDIADYVRHTLTVMQQFPEFEWLAHGPNDWREPWEHWSRTRYEAKALKQGRKPFYLRFRRLG